MDFFADDLCRACIQYRNQCIQIDAIPMQDIQLQMPYPLTQYQEAASEKLLKLISNYDVCVEAVCGAGKTEMCVPLLKFCFETGLSVAWATPRKQIVLELSSRLRTYFPQLDIVSVCEGYTEKLVGDLIVCTNHQLGRYYQQFDVLIVDEPDAFPLRGNPTLMGITLSSVRGHCVFLSATFETYTFLDRTTKVISVPIRPSNALLPVPKMRWFSIQFFIDLWVHRKERCLIFVPTKLKARYISIALNVPYVTSESKDREGIIEDFRKKKSGVLVTTTILERGVTFPGCFVFVLWSEHEVFDEATLVQIAGRVRRGTEVHKGECYFYVREKNEAVKRCIKRIQRANIAASALKQETAIKES